MYEKEEESVYEKERGGCNLNVKEEGVCMRRKKGAYMKKREPVLCKKEGGRREHMCEKRGSPYCIV